MKLESFDAGGIYGYLNFSFEFFDDITFLHGINGGGKTTALKAIVSLLTPDIIWLTTTKFRFIKLKLETNGDLISISAEKTSTHLNIQYTGKKSIRSSILIEDLAQFQIDDNERSISLDRLEWVKAQILTRVKNDEAIRLIGEIPTPTFLGLERTTLPFDDPSPPPLRNDRRLPRPYSRTSMDGSLREANRLLQIAIRNVLAEKARASEVLRTEIVFSLFNLESRQDAGGWPKKKTIQQFRDSLVDTFHAMKFDREMIKNRVERYFEEIISVGEQLVPYKNPGELIKKNPRERAEELIVSWFRVSPSL